VFCEVEQHAEALTSFDELLQLQYLRPNQLARDAGSDARKLFARPSGVPSLSGGYDFESRPG
jgi:hypothetical protein